MHKRAKMASMTLTRFLRSFVIVFLLHLLLDGFWHVGIMAEFYRVHMSPVLYGAVPSWSWTITVLEGINAVTLTYIVQSHLDQKRSLADVLWVGGLLGFTVVSSMNLLNMNFLGWWNIQLAAVDIAWGTVVGIVGAMAVIVTEQKKRKGFFALLKAKKW
jgi:uncharacterized membrane protein